MLLKSADTIVLRSSIVGKEDFAFEERKTLASSHRNLDVYLKLKKTLSQKSMTFETAFHLSDLFIISWPFPAPGQSTCLNNPTRYRTKPPLSQTYR